MLLALAGGGPGEPGGEPENTVSAVSKNRCRANWLSVTWDPFSTAMLCRACRGHYVPTPPIIFAFHETGLRDFAWHEYFESYFPCQLLASILAGTKHLQICSPQSNCDCRFISRQMHSIGICIFLSKRPPCALPNTFIDSPRPLRNLLIFFCNSTNAVKRFVIGSFSSSKTDIAVGGSSSSSILTSNCWREPRTT
jgi:hypothetical protein